MDKTNILLQIMIVVLIITLCQIEILENKYNANVRDYNNITNVLREQTNKMIKLSFENMILEMENDNLKIQLEKQIPSYIKYLNNSNNWSSCWKTENGTRSSKRKEGCYNCENFSKDYIANIQNEYELYYVSGQIEGHEMGHAFVKVCIYVNPTGNEIMSKEQFERYEINYEKKN